MTSDHLRLFCQDSELFIPLQPDDAKPKSGAQSIPVEHFEKLYRDNGDPWGYLTSDYENKKYAATLDMLPQRQFRRGLEIGCSIGVLTRMLAGRCSAVIGIDFVDQAVATASRALADLPHVEILKMTIPNEIPDGDFDLIVLSEVLYFFSEGDMSRLATFVAESLVPGGTCVVVNFRGDTQAVSSGAQALGLFKRLSDTAVNVVANKTSEHYEIEVLRRL